MAKFNPRENDPERYARVKAEQKILLTKAKSQLGLARLCPYCDYKLSIILKGEHSWTSEKCPNCGEVIVFPPISFRMASNH
ncbi:MAG: hypothetical protein U0L73_03850 [Ruminococcus bromii]|jgi:predicted RNA-binding Zn-ribbon protein involved in translation (DUF1610 family)|nr:hypothetical protein [Ruminococcus bromii]